MYSNCDKNNSKLIEKGVRFANIHTNMIDDSVSIGTGSEIGPFVVLQNNVKIGCNVSIDAGVIIKDNVTIGDNVRIMAYSYIVNNVRIHDHVFIGQYTILRDNVNIGMHTSIGPYCEMGRATIGCNCGFGHRNYVCDAIICDGVKFGIGASTLNSNWQTTFRTFINKDSKIGGNVNLIAPINIGEKVTIGAGSTVTCDLPDNTLCIARAEVTVKTKK